MANAEHNRDARFLSSYRPEHPLLSATPEGLFALTMGIARRFLPQESGLVTLQRMLALRQTARHQDAEIEAMLHGGPR